MAQNCHLSLLRTGHMTTYDNDLIEARLGPRVTDPEDELVDDDTIQDEVQRPPSRQLPLRMGLPEIPM